MQDSGELRRKERLGFIVLQHIHTLDSEPALALLPDVIASTLAITPGETREILTMLAAQGYVGWTGPDGPAALTDEGEDYLLRRADRRRSVRFKWIIKPGPADGAAPSEISGEALPEERAERETGRPSEPRNKRS